MKKLISVVSMISFLALVIAAPITVYAAGGSYLTALDTVKGFDTQIRGTGFIPGDHVVIQLNTPYNQQHSVSAFVDQYGMLRTEVDKGYLLDVGTYTVSVHEAETQFEVYGMSQPILALGQETTLLDVGGDDDVLLAQADSVARFEIDTIPASASTNEQISFRMTAVDANGAQVSSYRGTVNFTSSDPNAHLPTPYTFTANDQGRKTFDVSASFATTGTHTLTIRDQQTPVIRGEKSITITDNSAQHSSSDVRITRPAAGTYVVNTLEVAGEAIPNARVKIFDNGQQISEVQANSVGRFTYTTSLLNDGPHTFQAESNGSQSVPVLITIDSTPSQVQSVQISEKTLAPGATTLVTLHSDTDLTSVQLTVGNDFITDLEPDAEELGTYRGTITAPQLDGEYTVNAILTDKVGNVGSPAEIGKITVDSSLKGDSSFSFNVPSKVKNVVAVGGNGSVSLTWDPAEAEVGIAMYRIYYGTNPRALKLVVNTTDSKPEFIVTGLPNGTEHLFQIVGVDTQGNEGDNLSDVVSSTPTETTSGTVADNSGAPALCDPSPCPADVPAPDRHADDGPGILIPVLLSLVGGGVLKRRKK